MSSALINYLMFVGIITAVNVIVLMILSAKVTNLIKRELLSDINIGVWWVACAGWYIWLEDALLGSIFSVIGIVTIIRGIQRYRKRIKNPGVIKE